MRKKSYIAAVIIGIGVFALCMAGALLQHRSGNETIADKLKNGIPLLFFGAFAVTGLVLISNVVIRIGYRKKHCTYVTNAVCTELKWRHDSEKDNNSVSYTPVYDFEYNGRNIRISNDVYTGRMFVPEIGSVDEIHVDIDELADYYVGNPSNGLKNKIVTGIIFSVPAMAILIISVLSGLSVIT